MVSLQTSIARRCAPWFPGIRDTALLSVLQGYAGSVQADDPENIRLIVARCGNFFYFGGDPAHPQAASCIRAAEAGSCLVSLEPAWVARFTRSWARAPRGERATA